MECFQFHCPTFNLQPPTSTLNPKPSSLIPKPSSLIPCLLSLILALPLFGSVKGGAITCDGDYPYHPQGVATDGKSIYWSFTTVIVKTDLSGKVLAVFDEKGQWSGHVGDLCCKGGHVFAGINRSFVNGTRPGDEVWELDADLNVVKKYPTPEMIWCNNGLEWHGGSFWLVSSAPQHCQYNFLFEYTPDFRFKRCMPVESGWTLFGVQTVALYKDKLLFGCYGSGDDKKYPHPCTVFAVDVKKLPPYGVTDHPPMVPCEKRVALDASCGMMVLNGKFMRLGGINLFPKEEREKWRWTAVLVPCDIDKLLAAVEGSKK